MGKRWTVTASACRGNRQRWPVVVLVAFGGIQGLRASQGEAPTDQGARSPALGRNVTKQGKAVEAL